MRGASRSASSERRRPSGWRRGALLLTGLLLALLATEAGLALLWGGRPLEPAVFASSPTPPGYRLAPSRHLLVRQLGRELEISTDARGQRLTPGATRPTGEVSRVHLIGDSQVFGWGLSDTETVAARLQVLLGPRFQVVNHGVPGWGPPTYARELAAVPREDWVVVVHAEQNDLWGAYDERLPARVHCGYLVARDTWARHLPCALMETRLVQLLARLVGHVRHGGKATPLAFAPRARVAAGVLRYRLEQLYAPERQARGERLLFTHVPWDGVYIPSRLEDYLPRLQQARRHTALPDDCGVERRFSEAPEPAGLFLPTDDHLSPRGAELLARCVYDELVARIPPSPSEPL